MRVLTPPVVTGSAAARVERVKRLSLPSAVDDRLYFAQVREDPRLEIEALAPGPDDSIVVVGSGGCTALSLLTAGVGHVTAVDVNRAQNHLIELKVAALTVLSRAESLAFLGATPSPARARLAAYGRLRAGLSRPALVYWDTHRLGVADGVLNAGVTERFIRTVVRMLRLAVHPRARIERMLASDTLNAQRSLFESEWNTARWRAFFHLLLNRAVFRRAYDPAFFAHLERPSFADHFRWQAEHALTELSVRDNYFLHHMLTGQFPVDTAGGVPPYLSEEACVSVATSRERLTLVDGTITDHLRGLPDGSVTGFAISNICEWIAPHDVDLLFAEIVRTATPNATLCFRNFVGWTEVPPRFQHVITEDRVRGETMMRCDRSVVQRRFAFCRVRAGTHQ
jgi:S-adenosylmethionine-diacylglycerol 3-amino-3-carboxypropyl transferase